MRSPLRLVATAALLALAAPLLPAQSISYEVGPPSGWAMGCFPPCLCPIMFSDGVTGSFTSAYTGTTGTIQEYDIPDFELFLLGDPVPYTGSGVWSRDEGLALERLVATLTDPQGVAQLFDSGWVPWTPTPAGSPEPLVIDIAVNGFFCFDTAFYLTATANPAQPTFLRGDCNADGGRDISDAIELLDALFAPGGGVGCTDACDANDDANFDIADAIAVLGHLFGGTGPLPEPFAQCGPDPTADALGCAAFPPCP